MRAPVGEYLAKKTSLGPHVTHPWPQLTLPQTVPIATRLPLESNATDPKSDESKAVAASTCWFHKNCPPPAAVIVTIATAVSLLAPPCVSVTVIIAVYGPALA